jgi:hypothetical protein
MTLNLRFFWSEVEGEGLASKADYTKILEGDWVIAADFLVDIIAIAQTLYTGVLEKRDREEPYVSKLPTV